MSNLLARKEGLVQFFEDTNAPEEQSEQFVNKCEDICKVVVKKLGKRPAERLSSTDMIKFISALPETKAVNKYMSQYEYDHQKLVKFIAGSFHPYFFVHSAVSGLVSRLNGNC